VKKPPFWSLNDPVATKPEPEKRGKDDGISVGRRIIVEAPAQLGKQDERSVT
jgi:hypothetical protein